MTASEMAASFAALHVGPQPFLLPNAWDVASALMLEDARFPAIGTTSLGITAATGLPDGAGAGLDATLVLVEALSRRLSVPLTVDLEGGYSNDPHEVATLAARLWDLGVAGINLEDGRGDGDLRPAEVHAAVVAAVASAVPGLFINARTDTWWLGVGPVEQRLDETVRRLRAYADAGASGVFVPGLPDLGAMRAIASAVDKPLNVLWQPGLDLNEVAAAGAVRVSTGSALYRHSLGLAVRVAEWARDGIRPDSPAVDYAALQRRLAR
ncbi:MAG TPA: isocitrate lyase/phosphoenolpyruvate mutase family protein [Actinomycetales bacterium]|nr:isocitrate lyase/phosphoenolpyruvate mutase family protein [Actinomycetales bacterium]